MNDIEKHKFKEYAQIRSKMSKKDKELAHQIYLAMVKAIEESDNNSPKEPGASDVDK